ncbi:MAG: TetR/AcrR family transcriptional regulator [Propionibacteriaceae bacterium]|jgi:AcrR family transcriptional regulator|nr:TetR/AcrR family transcriptional regulator [Propionibacteriaceae bacterium]
MTDQTGDHAKAKKSARKKLGPREGTATRRREILEAAMKVFATKGFHAGTLNDVAELVGMTHAGVLHHFGSKGNLLQAVIGYRDSADSSQAHAAYGMSFFRHLIDTAKLNSTRPGIVQTYVVLSAEAVTEGNPGTEYFLGRFDGLRELVVSQLREISPAENGLEPAELEAAASNIIALMDGLQVQWLLNPDSVDLVDATVFGIEAIVNTVMAGSTRPAPLRATP